MADLYLEITIYVYIRISEILEELLNDWIFFNKASMKNKVIKSCVSALLIKTGALSFTLSHSQLFIKRWQRNKTRLIIKTHDFRKKDVYHQLLNILSKKLQYITIALLEHHDVNANADIQQAYCNTISVNLESFASQFHSYRIIHLNFKIKIYIAHF